MGSQPDIQEDDLKPFHLVWFLAGYEPRGWCDPRWDPRYDFRRRDVYLDMIRLMEKACLDAILIADQPSIDDTYTGSIDAALRSGCESITGDPLVALAMMGAVTEHIGLAATMSTSFVPPFMLARQFSALDHMTNGRAGWNVVTSERPRDGENFGVPLQHRDNRYDMADEYMELCNALWRSWEPDAVLMNRTTGQFADPKKVREVNFKGKWYSSRGPLPATSSPQRTPFIFQAGGSPRGRDFAAQHAEAILSNQNSTGGMKEYVDDVRRRAEAHNRRPRVLFSIQPVIGRTTEEALEKDRAATARASREPFLTGGLSFASMHSGIDLSKLDLDRPIQEQMDKLRRAGHGDSMLFQYLKGRPDTTPRDMAITEARKTTLPVVGSVEEVADRLCEIVEETGCDGFMIREALLPQYIHEVTELLVPALQRRRAVRTEYSGKTFRDHMNEF